LYERYYYGGPEAAYENSPESSLRQIIQQLEEAQGSLMGKRVLDFGCGIGNLCRLLLERGARVDATEPDPNARAIVRAELHIDAYTDLAELRAAQPSARYHLVTMFDVVEHLRSPVETLADVGAQLESNGTLLLETPDANSLKARLVRATWVNYQNPTHLYYFNWTSLERTLRTAGFARAVRWRPTVVYPSHGPLRRLAQTGLQRAQFDGALRALASGYNPA
jgi:trans-aconitate methyltransferase